MATIRTLALIFLFGPLAAMLVEPFFEALFDLIGWDTEVFAEPILNFVWWFTDFVAGHTSLLYFLMGLGSGVWVHFFAQKLFPVKNSSRESIEIDALGPQLPRLNYDTEWAEGILMMPIQDVACALCGIEQDGFASLPRARAIANDLVGAVSTGWVCSEDAYYHLMQKPIAGYTVTIAGKPKYPAIEEAFLNTRIYTPSLLVDYVKNHKNLHIDWIPAPEGKRRNITIEAH